MYIEHTPKGKRLTEGMCNVYEYEKTRNSRSDRMIAVAQSLTINLSY